jgi:hypothetical protein
MQVDAWWRTHHKWREDVSAILNDRDAVSFERASTAGSQTKASAGAFSQAHLVARGQLLENLELLANIIARAKSE